MNDNTIIEKNCTKLHMPLLDDSDKKKELITYKLSLYGKAIQTQVMVLNWRSSTIGETDDFL